MLQQGGQNRLTLTATGAAFHSPRKIWLSRPAASITPRETSSTGTMGGVSPPCIAAWTAPSFWTVATRAGDREPGFLSSSSVERPAAHHGVCMYCNACYTWPRIEFAGGPAESAVKARNSGESCGMCSKHDDTTKAQSAC